MIVVIFLIIISDLIASICEVQNLNNRLKQIDQLSNLLHDKSIALGENISDEALKKLRDRLNSKEQNPEKNEETKNKK